MTRLEMQEKAMDLFMKHLHRSQSVLVVAQAKLGKKNDDLVKALDPFGGGLGGHGEVCGAVVGGLAAIGLLLGRDKAGEEINVNMWKYSREFLKRFGKQIVGGGILCRDIVQVNWMDPPQVKEYYGEKNI